MQPINLPKRKRNRLEGFDYSSNGAYFITLCTDKRKQILSRIVGAIHESPLRDESDDLRVIHESPLRDELDDLRVFHESPLRGRSVISKAIGYLKMNTSRDMHELGVSGKIWQRSFHDHIIRTQKDYNKIFEYICCNPQLWQDDCFYTEE